MRGREAIDGKASSQGFNLLNFRIGGDKGITGVIGGCNNAACNFFEDWGRRGLRDMASAELHRVDQTAGPRVSIKMGRVWVYP